MFGQDSWCYFTSDILSTNMKWNDNVQFPSLANFRNVTSHRPTKLRSPSRTYSIHTVTSPWSDWYHRIWRRMSSAVLGKRGIHRRTAWSRTELESDFGECGTSRQKTFFEIALPGRELSGRTSPTLLHAANKYIAFNIKLHIQFSR